MEKLPIETFNKNWGLIDYENIKKHKDYYAKKLAINHRGQRKLLLCELSFLTQNDHLSNEVLYVGAAPGHHIHVLAPLFPHKMFYLYDPRDFDKELYKHKNIKIYQQFFTNEDAKNYNNCLFMSDIRTTEVDGEEKEKAVIENQEMQRQWCLIIKPKLACLKFRIPYLTESLASYKYFKGIIYLQPWSRFLSNETRLWTNCSEYKLYNSDYEKKMLYYNMTYRPENDTALEELILQKYAEKYIKKEPRTWIKKYKNQLDKMQNV